MFKYMCMALLKLHGWKIKDEINVTSIKKCIMVAAPHTSNWDYYYTMLMFFGLGIKFKYLAKSSLFKFPLGWLMRVTGGIPVDRTKSNYLIPKMVKLFEKEEVLTLVIAVEGTRSLTNTWKPGFYHIAKGANVPIACGYLDYSKRIGGFMATFIPEVDFVNDLPKIQSLYKDIQGKVPKQFTV